MTQGVLEKILSGQQRANPGVPLPDREACSASIQDGSEITDNLQVVSLPLQDSSYSHLLRPQSLEAYMIDDSKDSKHTYLNS